MPPLLLLLLMWRQKLFPRRVFFAPAYPFTVERLGNPFVRNTGRLQADRLYPNP